MNKGEEAGSERARISDTTVRRLSQYLRYLQEANAAGQETISSDELARRGGTTAAQVRKDLSHFGSFGKRGMGYSIPELLGELERILGLHRDWRVALIGAGRLGSALVTYRDFRKRGFEIVAVFDSDAGKVGQRWGGIHVRSDAKLEYDLRAEEIDIAIIAVPAASAQTVVDRVVNGGVRAILNFAPSRIRVPDSVALRNVDMAVELEGLAFALTSEPDDEGEAE